MQFAESPLHRKPDADDDTFRFERSLLELKDLRSQLHYAADYCETTFLTSNDKKTLVESTREYACRAVVTLVDHLGNVSANLECCVSKASQISEAQLRLDCLFQRLLSYEKFAHKFALTRLRWSVKHPTHHPKYILRSTTDVGTSREISRVCEPTPPRRLLHKNGQAQHLLQTTDNCKASAKKNCPVARLVDRVGVKPTLVFPVRDGLSILCKSPNPTFHFQLDSPKEGRRSSGHGADIFSLIRRTTRRMA